MNTRVAQEKTPMSGVSINFSRLLKPLVFVACLIPFGMAVLGVASNKFVDPVESLLLMSGEWGLRLLLVTLCVTPLQTIFKWPGVAKLRRMLGLFVFFYATVHLLVWLILDQELDVGAAVSAIVEKKFITLGIIVWIGLLILAVTSNRFSTRKLWRKWKKLHSWVYMLAVLAVVHFIWQVRANELLEPTAYLGGLAVLLLWRFIRLVKQGNGQQDSDPGSRNSDALT